MEIEARKTIYIPLNFLRTGDYRRSNGNIYERTMLGVWWPIAAGSATYGRYLNTAPTNINPQSSFHRGNGFTVRCVVREG